MQIRRLPVSKDDPLVVGHYYYLNPMDRNHPMPPRIMHLDREIGCWMSPLPILVPNDDLNRATDGTLDLARKLGKPVDHGRFILDCLRSLGGVVVDQGVMVYKPVKSVGTGIVTVSYTVSKRTDYHSMYTDLFIHPELVREQVESDDLAKMNSVLKVIIRLVTKTGSRIAEL